MKASLFSDEDQLVAKAIDILVKELGPVETSRFLSLPRKTRLESVKRHQQWQKELDKEQFFKQVFNANNT